MPTISRPRHHMDGIHEHPAGLFLVLRLGLPKPELTALRVTDWDDCGYPGAKFIQGFKLRADTLNQVRTVQVLSDGGTVVQSFQIQHANEVTKAYVFATPFISHLVRLAPTDINFWRIEGIEWIYNPAPELVTVWTTPWQTTHDLNGWFSHRPFLYVPLVSSAVVTLAINAPDNPASPFTYPIPSTGMMYDKTYLTVTGMKAKSVQYSLTSSAGFRVFEQDLEIGVKQWGSPGGRTWCYEAVRRPLADQRGQDMTAKTRNVYTFTYSENGRVLWREAGYKPCHFGRAQRSADEVLQGDELYRRMVRKPDRQRANFSAISAADSATKHNAHRPGPVERIVGRNRRPTSADLRGRRSYSVLHRLAVSTILFPAIYNFTATGTLKGALQCLLPLLVASRASYTAKSYSLRRRA